MRFSTYAVPMIIGEIRRYLRDNSPVRVSRSLRDNAYKALTAREAFTKEHQREPTVEEIAKAIGMKREEVVFALDAISDPISLYEPVYQDGGDAICVMDQVRDTKNTDDSWIEQIAMKQAMSGLSGFWPCGFTTAVPRSRWPGRSASPRPRSPAWKRASSKKSKNNSKARAFPAGKAVPGFFPAAKAPGPSWATRGVLF